MTKGYVEKVEGSRFHQLGNQADVFLFLACLISPDRRDQATEPANPCPPTPRRGILGVRPRSSPGREGRALIKPPINPPKQELEGDAAIGSQRIRGSLRIGPGDEQKSTSTPTQLLPQFFLIPQLLTGKPTRRPFHASQLPADRRIEWSIGHKHRSRQAVDPELRDMWSQKAHLGSYGQLNAMEW